MVILRSLLVASLFALATAASAQVFDKEGEQDEAGKPLQIDETNKEEMPKVPKVEDDSSRGNRVGKTAAVVAELGFAIAPLPSFGFTGSYFVMSDLLAEFNYVAGGLAIDDVDVGWSYMGVRAKWFVGNSFYLNLGYGLRTFDFSTKVTATQNNISAQATAEAEAKTSGLDFAIGNQWQWDTMTLGCDWIGYYNPISSSGDSKVEVNGVSPTETEDLNDILEQLGDTPNLQLLRFYVGVAF